MICAFLFEAAIAVEMYLVASYIRQGKFIEEQGSQPMFRVKLYYVIILLYGLITVITVNALDMYSNDDDAVSTYPY